MLNFHEALQIQPRYSNVSYFECALSFLCTVNSSFVRVVTRTDIFTALELFYILRAAILFFTALNQSTEFAFRLNYTVPFVQRCQRWLHVVNLTRRIYFAENAAPEIGSFYAILEVVHHGRTRGGVMNTLFWKHCFWHRPSILIMSGTCASAACKERVIYEDWPILSHIMCCCVRANTGVTGGALSHVIKWPSLITGSSACKIKQSPVSLSNTQKEKKKKLHKYLVLHHHW